jgi:hypothetical protein
MSTTTLSNIKKLVNNLPQKDIMLGHMFLEDRNFEALQALVDSALIKIRRSRSSDNPKEEYKDINLEALDTLKAEVDSYSMLLGIEPEDDFIENTEY